MVISDISMPVMNGLDMVRKMREIQPDIPIILLSAYSDKEKLLQAIEIGISKYMIKPLDPEELLKLAEVVVHKEFLVVLQDGYMFDLQKMILYHRENHVSLTKKELHFVTLLAKSAGELVTKEELKSALWRSSEADDTLLRTLVKRFRDKTSKHLVDNCQGLGYKIVRFK